MAASTYDDALRRLLAHEGGYSNHPADPGGPTKYGITLSVYRRYAKPDATPADVRAMTVTDAKAIYRARYWNALRCDELPAGVDYAVFDYGVNSGVARAARVLRHVVGAARGQGVDAAVLAAVRRREARTLINAICDERLAFLKRLKTWAVFGRGWSRRVAEVRAAALALAEGAFVRDRPEQPGVAAGKGMATVNRSAQRGTAGGIAATGVAATERTHDAGAPLELVLTVLAAAALLTLGAWFFWRWRAAREQARIVLPATEGTPA